MPYSQPPQPGMVWSPDRQRWEFPAQSTANAPPTDLSNGANTPIVSGGQIVPVDTFGSDGKTAEDYLQSNGLAGPPGTDLKNGPGTPLVSGGKPVTIDPFGADGKTAAPDPLAAQKAAAEADAAAAQKLRDAVLAERNPAPGVAPQVAAPAPIKAATVGGVAPVTAVAPKAATAAAPSAIAAPTIGGVTINPIERVQASQVGVSPLARAVTANAATLDKAPQQEFRTQQQQLSSAVLGAALGTSGPSAAQIQAQRDAQNAANQQLALVGMNHGRGAGGALRVAGQNIARLQSDSALADALLRAKETETARAQAIEATGQARSQDIGVAGTEAGFQQGANLQNSQLGTAVSQSNAQIEAARSMKDADLQQAAAAGNAAAQNELNRRTAELETQRRSTEATLGVDVAKSNQDAALRTALANAQNETQTNIVGATEANKVAMSNQDAALKTQLAQAGFDQQALLQMSDQELKTKLANAGFTLTQEQLDNQRRAAANDAAISMTQSLLQYRTGQSQLDMQRSQLAAQIEQARKSGDWQKVATLLTVGGTLIASAIGGGGGGNADNSQDGTSGAGTTTQPGNTSSWVEGEQPGTTVHEH